MASPIRSRVVIDNNASVDRHRDIVRDLLATRGITDTVATYFAIVEAVTFRVLTARVHALTSKLHVALMCKRHKWRSVRGPCNTSDSGMLSLTSGRACSDIYDLFSRSVSVLRYV